jgi:hypothetical protein
MNVPTSCNQKYSLSSDLASEKNLKSSAPIKRIPKRLTGSKAILQGGSLFRGQTRDFRSDCPQLSEGGG